MLHLLTLTYEIRIAQRTRASTPWTGVLSITINNDNIVNGRYPQQLYPTGPFRNQVVVVTGGLNGNDIRLAFGSGGRLTTRGTISNDGIVAGFWVNSTPYDFNAARVTES